MKNQINTSDIVNALLGDENADWTYNGALALAEWLEAYEEDTGAEMEFDRVALRCDFNEYKTALEAAKEYLSTEEIDNLEESALEYLRDNATVIEFDGGVIVSSF